MEKEIQRQTYTRTKKSYILKRGRGRPGVIGQGKKMEKEKQREKIRGK